MRWTKKFHNIKNIVVDYTNFLSSYYHRLFFGSLIKKGRKLFAFNNFLIIKKLLKKKEHFDPYLILFVSLLHITPEVLLGVLPLGSVRYGVPLPINEFKRITYAIKWVIKLSKDKLKRLKPIDISNLLLEALYWKGDSINKLLEVYNIAEMNRHLVRKLFK